MLLLNLAELLDFSDLYIKLYVFDDAKSDSDLKNGLDGLVPICRVFLQLTREANLQCLVNLHSNAVIACDTSM